MIVRQPTPTPTPTSATAGREIAARPEPGQGVNGSRLDEAEWERSLFLQPVRLDEARRRQPAVARRWQGLLLAGLAALAIGLGAGEARATETAAGKESSSAETYWAWLLDWMGGDAETESTLQQKSGEGASDPEEGEG